MVTLPNSFNVDPATVGIVLGVVKSNNTVDATLPDGWVLQPGIAIRDKDGRKRASIGPMVEGSALKGVTLLTLYNSRFVSESVTMAHMAAVEGDTEVFTSASYTKFTVGIPVVAQTDIVSAEDTASKEVHDWLDVNRANWRDPAAYWEEA